MNQDQTPRSLAPNLQRGLGILEYLAQNPGGSTVTELAESLTLPTASVFRITKALVDLGYLARDPSSKRFSMTNKFFLLGQPRSSQLSLSQCSIEAMRDIRRSTGETTQLCCLIETEMVIIEQLLAVHSFKYSGELGARCPCYSSAPGKAMIAFLPEAEQTALIDAINFKQFTQTTISGKQELRDELSQVQEQGWASDRAEGLEGIHCVSAPIMDRHNYPVAAITITGPSSRIPESEFESIGKVVCNGANKASDMFNR
ncbi:MAG: IclR family transcriptional regulator [Pirellulales bacterium]